MRTIAFYVSGHGFGHAVRTAAVLGAVAERAPRLRLLVRSEAPTWVFTRRCPGAVCVRAPIDVGVLQSHALEIDLPGTLRAHEAFLAGWDLHLAREVRWLEDESVDLVVGDVPPLAFAAAARVGIPSVAIANFGWDWILEPWAEDDGRLAPAVERYAGAYREAGVLYRLPFSGAFPAFRDVREAPLLAHRARRDRTEVLEGLGLDAEDPRPVVLVSFGGFGSGGIEAARWDDLRDYRFLGHGSPPPGFPARWRSLPPRGEVEHEELVDACDVLVGKPGYSTCAEVVAHGARFLHLPRPGFREVPILEEVLAAYPAARPMPTDDFFAGRWRRSLEAILALAKAPPVPATGADFLADALLARGS